MSTLRIEKQVLWTIENERTVYNNFEIFGRIKKINFCKDSVPFIKWKVTLKGRQGWNGPDSREESSHKKEKFRIQYPLYLLFRQRRNLKHDDG